MEKAIHVPVQIYAKELLHSYLSDKILKVFSEILTEILKEGQNRFCTSYKSEYLNQTGLDLFFDRSKIAIDELINNINLDSCKQEFLLQTNAIVAVCNTNYKQNLFDNIMAASNFEKTEELYNMLNSTRDGYIFLEATTNKNDILTVLSGEQIASCLGWENICASDPRQNTNVYRWSVYVSNSNGESKIKIKGYGNDNKPFVTRYSSGECEVIGEVKEEVILVWKNQIFANKIFNYFYKKAFELPMFKNEIVFINPIDNNKTIGFIDMDTIDFGNYIAQQARKYT